MDRLRAVWLHHGQNWTLSGLPSPHVPVFTTGTNAELPDQRPHR